MSDSAPERPEARAPTCETCDHPRSAHDDGRKHCLHPGDGVFLCDCQEFVAAPRPEAGELWQREQDAVREFAMYLTQFGTTIQREKLAGIANAYLAARAPATPAEGER